MKSHKEASFLQDKIERLGPIDARETASQRDEAAPKLLRAVMALAKTLRWAGWFLR